MASWHSGCSTLLWGSGSTDSSPCVPTLPSSSASAADPYPPSSVTPSLGPSDMSGLLCGCRGLATRWAAPRREVNYSSHDALACSSCTPSPPIMGEVRPLQPWSLDGPPLFTLPPHFVLRWGGGCSGLGGYPPSHISGHTQRACAPARGVSPPLLLGEGSPPLPPALLHAVRWERTLLGGCPLFGVLV